ncbi:MAG TPA: hypothetical protein VG265_06010, partial [Gaiellaceae bacterium]|nr:hypothetical protein [Gaiellaceae bacterium]
MIRSVVAAAVLVLVFSAADASAAAPITIRPSIAPSRASFGDTVVARITIELDAESVSAATLDVAPSFGPYVELGAPRIERRRSGGKETVTYSYSIQCLTDGCLPGKESAVVRFPRVTVTGRSSARTVRASASWPALTVRSRLAPADLSRAPRFRRPATVPPPSFAVPGALTVLLVALAALLGV